MKFEFITLDKFGEEAKWLCNFLEDIPCCKKLVPTISIHCDSQSTGHKIVRIMVNLDIFVGDIISLNN